MGIAIVIVCGLVVMTVFASGFDFLTKRRNRVDNETKLKVVELEKKVSNMEQAIKDKDARVAQLESDYMFLNKLLEKK